MHHTNSPTIDQFEHRFIFRLTRGMPLLSASVAAVLLVIAVAVVLFSFVPPARTAVPPPAPAPSAVMISYNDVLAYVTPAEAPKTAAEASTKASEPVPATPASEAAVIIATKLHETRNLTSEHGISWLTQTERYCSSRSPFSNSCYEYRTRTTRRGIGPAVLAVLELYDKSTLTETAKARGTEEGYIVNPSNSSAKISALDELIAILKATPKEDASKIAFAWAELRTDLEKARTADIEKAATAHRYAEAAARAKYQDGLAKKAATRASAFSGIGILLGVIFTTGMLLAVLAIERNTRALRHATATLQPTPPITSAET